MKYIRNSNKSNFSHMTNLANFQVPWGLVAGGTALGGLAGVVGGSIYNQNRVNSSTSNSERSRLQSKADKFNRAYDKWDSTRQGWLADIDTPEGKAFVDSNKDFVEANQQLINKYSIPAWQKLGIVGGSAALGAAGAYGLSRLRK